jgi:hypothetical protein
MQSYLQDLLNTDIDELLEDSSKRLIPELPNITNCIVLYGNEPWFLEAYCKKIVGAQNCDLSMVCDMTADNYIDQVDNIKTLKTLRTINQRPHYIYVKNLRRNRCKFFHHIIDRIENMIIVIESPRVSEIDECMKSRGVFVNLTVKREKMLEYCKARDISVEGFEVAYAKSLGGLTGTLLRLNHVGDITLDAAVIGLLDKCVKARSFLVVMIDIKGFVQKAFHLNVPLSYLCRVVMVHYQTQGKLSVDQMRALSEVSAKYDHKVNTTYKDLFVYEKYFIEVLDILKQAPVKRGRKKPGI